MTPLEFEHAIAAYLETTGYRAELTPVTNDYCVDIFATKEGERLAVQCKMYGGSERRVNRATVLELYGAAAYFDCTGSMIATNGMLMPDALAVAVKLGVQILIADSSLLAEARLRARAGDFSSIWERYVLPLAGRTIVRPDGKSNTIVTVDWSGVRRITSTGGRQFISIEIFEWAINKLLSRGFVTRFEVNQEYVKRASRGVMLILSQVPLFKLSADGERLDTQRSWR